MCTQVLASFAQVVFLRLYSFSVSWILGAYFTNEGTEVQNGLYPGELLVYICVCGSKQFLPLQVRSQPAGLGATCASFLPLRVPGEMWQKLLPCSGSGLPSGPDLGGGKNYFSSMALGMPALGGMQDSCHHHSELVFIERDS